MEFVEELKTQRDENVRSSISQFKLNSLGNLGQVQASHLLQLTTPARDQVLFTPRFSSQLSKTLPFVPLIPC